MVCLTCKFLHGGLERGVRRVHLSSASLVCGWEPSHFSNKNWTHTALDLRAVAAIGGARSVSRGSRAFVVGNSFAVRPCSALERAARCNLVQQMALEASSSGAESSSGIVHIFYEEMPSTQTYVEENYDKFDQTTMTVVSADFQTAGRGTGSRTWKCSRKCSLLSTYYFRFPAECADAFVNKNAPNVTKVLAISTVDLLKRMAPDLDFGVKWPNDIIVEGGKMGGILARAVMFNGRLEGIIIGIGLNINTPQDDLAGIERPVWPPISVRAASATKACRDEEEFCFDIEEMRQRLALEFASNLRGFFTDGFESVRARVNAVEVLMGRKVHFRVNENEASFEGTFAGVDDHGHITLQSDDGVVTSYPCGEIIPTAVENKEAGAAVQPS